MAKPATVIVIWLAATLALPSFGWLAIAVAAGGIALARPKVLARWWKQVRRARWLLFTLWIILAFGTPGEALLPVPWTPTDAGVDLAGLHVLRLVLLLGFLALLFDLLDQNRLVAGLWAVASPLRHLGVGLDRGVVRLALVFDYLEHAPPRGTWRHFLDFDGEGIPGPDTIRLERLAWSPRDVVLILAALAMLGLLGALP